MAETAFASTNGVVARPSTREIGTAGIPIIGGQIQEEFSRAWKNQNKVRTIREMMTDPYIARSLWTFEVLIRSAKWDVEPVGEAPEELEAAEFVCEVLFEDQSHSWHEALSNHLSMIMWGWAWHELVWKRRLGQRNRREKGLNSKFTDGQWGLRKTALRNQDTLFEWDIDEHGGIQAMVQMDTYATPARGSVRIPIEESLLFRTTTNRNSPEGRSLLRGAYIPWYYKRQIATFQGIGIERDLAGLPMIRVPIAVINDPAHVATKALYEKMGTNIRKDEQAYVMLPSIRDEHGEYLYDFTLVSSTGSRQMDTQPVIEGYNKDITIALMTDVVLIGHESVGSLALHSSTTELLSYGLGGFMDSIADVYNRHFIPRLWAVNGKPTEIMPKLVHGDIEQVNLDELGNFIVRMAQGGFDMMDVEDEIRRRAGFPIREDGSDPSLVPNVPEPSLPEDRIG